MQNTTRRVVYPTHVLSWRQAHVWEPPTDVFETENELVVKVEVAGMRDGDFQVSLEDRRLTVSGARGQGGRQRRAYYQMEVHSGEFFIEVELPVAIDPATVRADYDDGFLRITMSKAPVVRVVIREVE